MGCCASKSSSVRSPKEGLDSAQQNPSLGKKGERKQHSSDKRSASVEDFQLAPVQNFESYALGQKPVPCSTNSLDELCGRKEKKSEKEERSSMLNKLLIGKKDNEVLQNIDVSKSKENVVNGEETGVEEEDVGIEICPVDHFPDNDNPDIDIYPLDQDGCSMSNNVGELSSHNVNGMDCIEAMSLNPVIHKLESDVNGNKEVNMEKNAVIATLPFKNRVDPEMTLSGDALYRHVLLGNMEVAIPNLTKMVRIYASSANTDTQVERNALISRVYPKLKEFCHELGYEFHMVDIHWGVQNTFLDDHMTSEISKIEFRTCQELSTGPNFVTFLSQKYGHCLFPPKIFSNEFDLLWNAVEDQEDRKLLHDWFKLDNNAIPPDYILQPISSQFPNVVNPPNMETRNQAWNEWWDVFLTLWNALSNVAVKVLKKDQVHKYFMSGAEQEIRGGILKTTHPHSQAFWFHRRITDLKENITSDLSPRYIDLVKAPMKQSSAKRTSKTADKSAEKRLNSLKETQLHGTLDKNNIVSYNIKWTEKGVDPNSCSEHAQYIDKFCQDVSRIMKERISQAVNKRNTEMCGPLFEEVAQHTLFCQQFCCNFYGRDETLDEIKNYILSGSSNTPMIIHGRSGCGKTSLVAMAAKLTRPWAGMEAAVVVRFLGKTRHSSNVHLTVRSIFLQLTHVYGIHSNSVPLDSHDLMTKFQSLLQNASASRPLVLFLDSLDQLRSCSIVQELSWLPRKLPPHVKLVMTCSSEDQTLSSLRNIFSDESHYLEVPDLTDKCASDMLRLWLADKNRKLTESQQHLVLQQFTQCRTPLYLKIAFSRALQWKSYSVIDEAGCGLSVRHSINSLFTVLEVRHGKAVVQQALSYMTASRRGLSDSELEDIMSCDEVVLDEVFRFWAPAIRRAPPLLWPRIRCDLDSFLATHVENGIRLTSWSHQEFHNVVMERYLFSDDGELHRIHSNLADFFLGRWSQGSKKSDAKGNLKDRYVSSQPLLFNTNLFNFRKLDELPYHLTRAEDFDRLKQNALCNFEFLSAKLRATSVGDLIDDFIEALAVKPDDPDVKLVFETLLLSIEALNVSADQLSSQLIGRLSSPRSPSAFSARLLRQAHHPSVPALIPNTPCLARPGGRLVHSFPMLSGPLRLNHDGSEALSGSHDQLITLWDVRSGKTVKSLDTSKPIGFLEFCLDGQLVVASCQGSVQLWNLAKEQMEWEIASTEVPAPITIAGSRDTLVAITGSVIKFVKVSTGTLTREYEDKTFIHDRIAGQGGTIALANSSCAYVRIYDLNTKSIYLSVQAYSQDSRDVVSDVLLTPFNGGQLIVSSQKSCGLRVFDLTSGKCLHVLGPDIHYPTVTRDGRYMLCTNKDNIISIWNLETAVKEKNVLKHPPTATIVRIVSLDLRIVVTVADDLMARVWDLQQQDASHTNFEDNKDENSIQQLVLIKSSVQKQVITKSKTRGPICVWSLSSCQVIRTLNSTNADEILVVDDTRAVIRSGTKLALIDLQEGKLIKHMRSDFPAKTDKVHRHASSLYKRRDLALRLAESPKVASMSKPLKFSDAALVGTTHVLVLSKDRLYLKVASLETGELVAKLKGAQKAVIETVMVSGNGLVAVCSCENAPLIVWDLRERSKRFTLEVSGHYPRLTCADISYNGHYLVDVMKLDKTHKSVVTWDLESGNVKHIIGQGINVWSVSLSSVSMRLVVAGQIGDTESLRVYNLVTGDFLHQLNGHTEPVKGVCLSKDGRRALTYVPLSGRDRTVRLWDLVVGTLVSCFTPDLPVSSCIVTDDGDQVVMVINKSRPIVSLALSHEIGSRELSVDLSNPYFSHPTLHGAVFEMGEELKWNDDGDDSDTEV